MYSRQSTRRWLGLAHGLTVQNQGGKHTEFSDYTAERQAFVTLRLGW